MAIIIIIIIIIMNIYRNQVTSNFLEPVDSNLHPSTSNLRFVLMFSSHLYWVLQAVYFLQDFATANLPAFLFCPMRATYLAHVILLDSITFDE
jgi:hypothetical protein